MSKYKSVCVFDMSKSTSVNFFYQCAVQCIGFFALLAGEGGLLLWLIDI